MNREYKEWKPCKKCKLYWKECDPSKEGFQRGKIVKLSKDGFCPKCEDENIKETKMELEISKGMEMGDSLITFAREGKVVGNLTYNSKDKRLEFTGDTDEAAKMLFDELKKHLTKEFFL